MYREQAMKGNAYSSVRLPPSKEINKISKATYVVIVAHNRLQTNLAIPYIITSAVANEINSIKQTPLCPMKKPNQL